MTKISSMAITGDRGFMSRYRIFADVLAERCGHLERLPSGDVYDSLVPGKVYKALFMLSSLGSRDGFSWQEKLQKRRVSFLRKSRHTERKILGLARRPDLVLHLFGMYAPFSHESAIPFTMSLDYTMALAVKEWPGWAPFSADKDRREWLDAEGDAFKRAAHLFPWSNHTKQSLMEDYGVPENKITVTGSAGQFRHPYDGPKTLGSHQIIFNGSEWERKGGDIVLDAFRQVRAAVPDATLVIVGTQKQISEPGVTCPGHIDADAMQALMLGSDLLLAPARCEPYGSFLVEGMNYGIPCIAAPHGGMPEIVDDGVNGIVLPALTAECLAESIISLLQDPARLERFSVNARDKVRTTLNWDAIVGKIFGALEARGIAS